MATSPLDDAEIAVALGLGDSADRVYAKYAPAIRMVGDVGSNDVGFGRAPPWRPAASGDAPGGGERAADGGPGPSAKDGGAATMLPRDPSGSLEDGLGCDAPDSPDCVMSLDPPGDGDDGDDRRDETAGRRSTTPRGQRRKRHPASVDLEPPTGCPPGLPSSPPATGRGAPGPPDRSDIHARIEELRDRSMRLRGAASTAGTGEDDQRGWRSDRIATYDARRSLSPSWRDRRTGRDADESPARGGPPTSPRCPPPSSSPAGTRLEYLTRRSMELRGRAARAAGTPTAVPSGARYMQSSAQYPTSSAQYSPSSAQQYPQQPQAQHQVPKKVTFEADYVGSPRDERPPVAVVSRPSPNPSSFKSRAAPTSSSAPPVPSLRPPASPRSRRDDAYGHHPRPTSPSALSLRLLSEKILDGHVMSRSRCGTCGSALLLPPGIRLPRERGACAVCPALAARGGISRAAVSRRVAAARLLHDDGDVPTADEVLDAACVEAAREEGRGSKWVRRADGPCGGCGSPNAMATRDGGEACPACNVMDRELGPACHREVRQDAAPTEGRRGHAERRPGRGAGGVELRPRNALERRRRQKGRGQLARARRRPPLRVRRHGERGRVARHGERPVLVRRDRGPRWRRVRAGRAPTRPGPEPDRPGTPPGPDQRRAREAARRVRAPRRPGPAVAARGGGLPPPIAGAAGSGARSRNTRRPRLRASPGPAPVRARDGPGSPRPRSKEASRGSRRWRRSPARR